MRFFRDAPALLVLLATAACGSGSPMEPQPAGEAAGRPVRLQPVPGVPAQPMYDGGPTIGSGYSKPQA